VKKTSEILNRAAFRPAIDRARLSVLVTVAAISCLAASVQSASANCQKSGFRFYLGTSSVNLRWRVDKNEPCSTRVRAWGKHSVDNLVMSQRASHGLAGVNNSMSDDGFAYFPASGFVGKDHFQVTLDNHDNRSGDTVKMTIDVDVEVVDTISPH
jgi:hypothetical protein